MYNVANAAPTPSVSFTEVDDRPMIGEKTTFMARFDNAGDAVGFGPFVDMLLPTDFANPTVNHLTQSLSVRTVGTYPAGVETCYNHPFAKEVSGAPVQMCLTPTEEVTLYTVQLPFGSFTETQTAADLDITVDVAPDAEINVAQHIQMRGGFYLGADALSNPTSDPSLIGSFGTQDMTPTVLKVRKQYISTTTDTPTEAYMKNEYEIVPGANHLQRFRITANIADGADLENIVLRDILPAPLKLVGVDMVAPNAVNPGGFVDQSNLLTNTAEVHWVGPVTGSTSTTDVQFDIIFEVPYKDAADAVTWNHSIGNNVTADAEYNGDDLPTLTEPIRDGNGTQRQLYIKPMLTQKTVSKVGGGAIKPSDQLDYTIRMYLSDYVAMNNMQVSDILDDGLTYVPGSAQVVMPGQPATNITPSISIDSTSHEETLHFDLSGTTLVGGCIPAGGSGASDPDCGDQNNGRTIVTVTFRAVIDETYERDGSTVYQGHTLNNRVTTTADILSPSDLLTPAGSTSDGSDAWVQITEGNLAKTIYAVNGSTVLPSRLKPGDDVTYRLQYSVPNTDFDALQLDDYLPLPMFTAAHVTTFDNTYPYSGTPPVAGTASFGPAETLHAYTGNPVPTISHPGGNVVRFIWNGQSDNANTSRVIDILFTVEIGNQPYAPGMFITNQATSTENNITATATNTVIQSIEMEIPEPVITKGVVQTDASSPAYTPIVPAPTFSVPGTSGTRFTGTITSGIDTNLGGIDGGDLVTYAVVVENTGKGDMYNARVRDQLPADMQIPAGGLNLRVTDGTGTEYIAGTDFTNTPGGSELFNIAFTTPIPHLGSTPGENVVVITYDLEAATSLQPRSTVTNTAQLTRFAAEDGGVNYIVDQTQYQDDAIVTAKSPAMTKAITGTALADTTGNNVVVGEEITYTVTLTVPEGTMTNAIMTDTLDACLAATNLVSLTASGGISSSNGDMNTVLAAAQVQDVGSGDANKGRRIVVNLGTLTNSNSSNGTDETVTLVYRAVPINASTCANGNARNNDVTLGWNTAPNAETLTASSPNVTIREPLLTVAKTFTPTSGDANDVTRVRVTVTAGAAPRTAAYDVNLSDILSSTHFNYVGNLAHFSGVVPATLTESGGTVSASWAQINPGQSSAIEFDVRLNSMGYAAGSVHPNSATATYTSYPGSPAGLTTYNPLAVERTGNTGDVGGAENDHRATGNANYTITNVTNLTKSIIETSEGHTAGSSVAIGEIVRYRLSVQIPESTTNNMTVRDTLPAGLEYLGRPRIAFVGNDGANTVISSAIAGGFVTGNNSNVVPATDIPGGAVAVSGQQIDFNLGTITNTDNDADSEYIVIEFNALVRNNAGNIRSGTINNQFTVRVGGTQQGTPSNTVTTTIVEPNVQINKAVTQAPVDAGDTVVYTITITNPTVANGTTGHDMIFTDVLDQHLQYVSVGSITSPIPLTPQHTVNGAGRDVVTIPISALEQGQAISFTVTATVKNSAPASYVVPNTGEVTTTSLPGANGTVANSTGQSTPGASGTVTGEREYSTNSSANTALGDPSIAKTGPTEGNTAGVGATVTYPITVTVPQGVTQNVTITDNLPTGLAYVSHSADISTLPSGSTIANPQGSWRTQPASAPGASGEDLILNLGTIAVPGDSTQHASFVITVVARVLDISTNINGTVLGNTASLTYTHPDDGPKTITTPPVNFTVREPRLALTKSLSGTGMRNVGDTLSYTVAVTNTGFAPAHEWRIDDILPQHTSISTAPACTLEGAPIGVSQSVASGTLTITPSGSSVVQVGEVISCTYGLTILSSAVVGSTYTNTADVDWRSGPSASPDTRNHNDTPGNAMDQDQDTDDVTFTMTGADFTKAADRTTATIGEVVTYTLTINAPSGVVQDLLVADTLPAGLEFVGTTSIANTAAVIPTVTGANPSTVEWNFGTITHSGNPITIEYQARVQNIAGNQDGVSLTNTAEVQFTPQDADPVSETDTATVGVREPVLVIAKSSSETNVRYGKEVEYTVTVTHDASSTWPAHDVIIADTLPTGLTLVAGSVVSPSGWSVSESSTGFTATRGSLSQSDGAQVFTYRAVVAIPPSAPAVGASLVNDARVTWTSVSGTNTNERTSAGGINDYTASDNTTITAEAINLAIAKTTTSTSVLPGEPITYDLEVTNTGSVTASDITVTETVPAHAVFTGPAGWTCMGGGTAGATCTFAIASLASGASQTIQFAITVDDYETIDSSVTEIYNKTTVAASAENGVETTMVDNESDVTVPLQVADIGVTKVDDVDPVLHLNHDYNYTITVTNHSLATTATNVRVHDELPDGVTFNGVADDDSAGYCTEVNGVIDCLIPTLAAGDSVGITVNVTGDRPGRVVNEVTVIADQQDSNRDNNHDDEVTLIDPADLEVVKEVNHSTVSLGGELIYTLTVTNHGPDDSTDTTVVDTLPDGLEVMSASANQGDCATSGQTVSCNLDTLLNGDSTSVAVTAKAHRLGGFTNHATVAGNEYDPDLSNNESEVSITVLPLAPDTGLGRTMLALPVLAGLVIGFGVLLRRRRHA